MAIQQLMLGVGASKKTYMDDVFNTHAYKGTSSAQTINNGIDLSGEGGLVWSFGRDTSWGPYMVDTERGAALNIHSSNQDAEDMNTAAVTGFNNNGYSLGADGSGGLVNYNTKKYVSWTFRKAKGFFDVVTYTGNGTARTIAHSLGSVPGMIMVKKLNSTGSWGVYHRDLSSATYYLALNSSNGEGNNTNFWNGTHPTSTHFSVGTDTDVNGNGDEFVAYVFAGGESKADTARCVEMDGSDYFDTSTSSDYTFGTGDFTVETWIRVDEDYAHNGNYPTILDARTDGSYTNFWVVYIDLNKNIKFYNAGGDRIISNKKIERGLWYHIAVVRNSGVTQLYVNGTSQGTYSDSTNYSNSSIRFGANAISAGYHFDGAFSNLRVVKGTAVYTASFRPPTAPLTNITNTKLLCFNNSSTTGTTVGTITATGDSTASTDSPFDDSTAFSFGDSKEGIIKCGSYVGNGSSTGPEIDIGWEPQWLLIKNTSSTDNWHLIDSIRGMYHGKNDTYFTINTNSSESDYDFGDPTPTGFQLKQDNLAHNENDDKYVYCAIRRPDGYVGKPAEAGTDVFTTVASPNNTNEPLFVSNFIVDFALMRNIASSADWYTGARLTRDEFLRTTSTASKGNMGTTYQTFDMNNGWWNGGAATQNNHNSWMWKRHAGFDVVNYDSTGVSGLQIPHNLGVVPEMIWTKNRDNNYGWGVYHKGLNGGTNPEQYRVKLESSDAEAADEYLWNDTAPTATHVTFGNGSRTNYNATDKYIMMLFSSISGISKVGSYTGNGTSSITISGVGFSPRLVIVKNTTNDTWPWLVLDTTRGFASGNDAYIYLNSGDAQETNYNFGQPTSDGFTWSVSDGYVNQSGSNYIYYAHA